MRESRSRVASEQLWTLILILVGCLASPLSAQDHTVEIRAHVERARAALARNDLPQAGAEYTEILKLDPDNIEVNAAEGVVLYGLRRPREAVAFLKNALRLDPNQRSAELFLGLSQSDLGQCQEAIPLLRKHFIAQTPAKLYRLAGLSLLNCYVDPSQVDDALDVGRSLKKAFPDDPDVLYKLAELYTQLWDATAGDLLKTHPESYRVHQLAGELLEAQGKAEQAIKEYGLALKINDQVPRLHYRIGRLIFGQGNPGAESQARAYFQGELVVNPRDAASEYSIGEIDLKEHRLDQAEKHFRRAQELDPQFTEAYIGLAKDLIERKQSENSVEVLRKAIELRPDDPTAHYTLMLAYRDLGKLDDAGREAAIFQKLQTEKAQDFNARLHSLLTGNDINPENRH